MKYPNPEDEPLEEICSRTDTPPGVYYADWVRTIKPEWDAYLEGLKKPNDLGLPVESDEVRLSKLKYAEVHIQKLTGIELLSNMPFEQFVGYGYSVRPEPENWHILPIEAGSPIKIDELDIEVGPQSELGFEIRFHRDDPER